MPLTEAAHRAFGAALDVWSGRTRVGWPRSTRWNPRSASSPTTSCGPDRKVPPPPGSGETLDDLLPEAFATVREAAKRALGQRHFDVQLMGGMVLHQGRIAEMKTGEGKTLVATLPVYLNALAGKGVHVVTVNDYLAKRDAEWMGQIYNFLGLTVGCIVHGLTDDERSAAYACDVTYGTNNELGFDYLRDNMKFTLGEMVHRPIQLRHRRRSRFDPGGRGAHAADHLRPDRGQFRSLPPGRPGHAPSGRRRFREGREGPRRHPDRDRRRAMSRNCCAMPT